MLSSKNSSDARLRKELAVAAPISRGKSKGAKLVQELLRLHRINVAVDGDLGPATEAGLAKFCEQEGLPVRTQVDQTLMNRLAQPLLEAVAPVQPAASLGQTVVATARQHLAQHPIEIGGQNRGPWVRLYMDGFEGNAYPWCAGFVTYVLRQAAKAHAKPSPLNRTYSCDVLGMEAKAEKRYVKRMSPGQAPDGSVFLVPHNKNSNDWVHTGIILDGNAQGAGDVFLTVEGNTNDSGSREGFEVCQRYRACEKVDDRPSRTQAVT